jgi:hypothetical protein
MSETQRRLLKQLEKTIGPMNDEDEHLNAESREFRDRIRAALAPFKAEESTEPRRSSRVHNYGKSVYRTKAGSKKSRKSRGGKKAHNKTHKR